jgi:hypothetical protein
MLRGASRRGMPATSGCCMKMPQAHASECSAPANRATCVSAPCETRGGKRRDTQPNGVGAALTTRLPKPQGYGSHHRLVWSLLKAFGGSLCVLHRSANPSPGAGVLGMMMRQGGDEVKYRKLHPIYTAIESRNYKSAIKVGPRGRRPFDQQQALYLQSEALPD